MTQRTCSLPDCERKHVAKGMCTLHYNRANYTDDQRHPKHERECVTCGTTWLTPRPDAKYCSELCYHYDKWGPRSCPWPPKPIRFPTPASIPFSELRECAWCGVAFVACIKSQVFCVAQHKRKAMRYRRRGRAHGSTSHFTWSEFMRIYRRFDRCCAYCQRPIKGQPDPDHVVPLRKGGSNSITNILPSCRLCNSDKRDLLLDEWAQDRAMRGKPPVATSWPSEDKRYWHLTQEYLRISHVA